MSRDHLVAVRVMKLAEETGEAAAAYIGMTGHNPRKGTCATPAGLIRELCDVTITAMVALATVTGDAAQAECRLQRHLLCRSTRLVDRIREAERDGPGQGEWACCGCGDAYFGTAPEHGLCPGCAASPSASTSGGQR